MKRLLLKPEDRQMPIQKALRRWDRFEAWDFETHYNKYFQSLNLDDLQCKVE